MHIHDAIVFGALATVVYCRGWFFKFDLKTNRLLLLLYRGLKRGIAYFLLISDTRFFGILLYTNKYHESSHARLRRSPNDARQLARPKARMKCCTCPLTLKEAE
jgi:hypothetical protein